jgi:response regulator RpfG family c-di-GMP phosphodiesterase
MSHSFTALIVEPNSSLVQPYCYLQQKLNITRVESVKTAMQALTQNSFDLFVLSASFSPEKTVTLLNAFKNKIKDQIIPLIFVVDLNQPLSTLPGTHWSGQLGLLTSDSSESLTLIIVDPLLSA